MATIISPSSPSLRDDDDHIPTGTLALPSIATAPASRRLPPPCWTPDETVALIDAYKDKWYSLRRGNLRANHWQEVADDVASRCPANPPKTAVQCRHKMEKLRKRYRAEIQRARASAAHGGVRRFTSSWAHFQNMHSMERGTDIPTPLSSSDDDDDGEDHKNSRKRINDLYNRHNNQNGIFSDQNVLHNGSTPGFRIKIPGGVTSGAAAAKVYSKFNEMGVQNPQNPNPRFTNSVASGYGSASNKVLRDGILGKRAAEMPLKEKANGDVGEVVAAIQALGEGFMRIEKVKMDMAREVEEMRMEMELKRTEMILESQNRIVDAFAKAISDTSTKKARKKVDYA